MTKKEKKPTEIICDNCHGCVFRHIAVTTGRCWHCKAQLKGRFSCG